MQAWCPQFIETGAAGELRCVDAVGTAVEWQDPPTIDFATVASPFSAGFILVASFWALGHGVSLVLGLVRR